MAGSNRLSTFAAVLAFLLCLAISGIARAATFTVTNTLDSGAGSLRDAITTANGAGGANTIDFSVTGTITLLSTLPTITDNGLSIIGPTGAPGITISGNTSVRVMVVNAGVSLQNLTIGFGTIVGSGGGIDNEGTLTVTNCTFFDNQSLTSVGGGIFNNGVLTVIGSTFSGNSALGGGGGIFNASSVEVTDSTFSGNSSFVSGGGIFNQAFATFRIGNTTFSENSAGTEGGGMFIQATAIPVVSIATDSIAAQTIEGSTFVDNSATTNGGAIENDGTLTVVINCTFSGNTTSGAGGAIDNTESLAITNATFAGNTADGGAHAGAIDNTGVVTLKSTILAGKSLGGNCAGTITDAGFNISDDATCAFGVTSVNDSTTLNLDPLGLQNNGGPTQTIALEPNSQAVDFIPVASCKDQTSPTPLPVITDQRGFPRPDSGNTSFCDAGAFELQTGRITVVPGSERTQIARPTTSMNSDQVNMAFTFIDNGSAVIDGAAPFALSCDAGNDALNGINVDLFEGTCATLSTATGGLLLDLTPFVVHSINGHSYGTIFQSDPPDMLQQTGETVSARIVTLSEMTGAPGVPSCGEWTINIEVASLDTAALGLGGGNPFALVVEDGDKNEGCFDVTNAVVGPQIPPPTHGVRRGSRRGRR